MNTKLKVARTEKPNIDPPQDRGELLTDAEVAALLKLDNPGSDQSRRWVREHVPKKKRIGHTIVRWFRADVLEWADQRDAG